MKVKNNIIKKVVMRLNNFFYSPEKVFIFLALIFGIIFSFTMPLFKVPDEHVHYYRAYQVGEGKIFSETIHNQTGGYVKQIPDKTSDYNKSNFRENFTSFPTAALYSPVAYVPQAIGVDTARLINPSIYLMMHVGRIFNLIAYILLVFLAIRLIPIGKWVLASVALFPISIQQAASMSSDVMTLGVVFISIATITRIFFQQNKVTKRQFIFLCIMSILLGLTKPTNLTVLILLLFVPKIKFNNNFDKFKKILAILLLGVLFEILWLIGTKYAGYNNNYQEILGLSQGIKPIEQLKYIFFNPLEFAETFLRSFVYEGTKSTPTPDFYIESMFGYMSLLSYKIPNFFMVLAYIGLFIALLYDKTKMSVKNLGNYAIGYFLVFVLSIIAVAVALYVVWTNVGAPQIAGIQGRYFLPIIPLLIVPFNYMTKFIIIKTDSTIRIGQIIFGISLINLSVASIITCIWFY